MINTHYIGITIGPIYDTISKTSSPAGMWAASYLFSMFSLELCEQLSALMTLVTPNLEEAKQYLHQGTGVGLLPDHLIFENTKNIAMEKINDTIAEAKEAIAGYVSVEGASADSDTIAYFQKYFQVHAVAFESHDNPIADSAQLLSAVELEQTFPMTEDKSPILDFVDIKRLPNVNPNQSKNAAIKASSLVWSTVDTVRWQLLNQKTDNIRDLEEIAATGRAANGNPMKKHSYYAIIQADGDGIGKHICGLPRDQINAFSAQCLRYSNAVSAQVGAYGGVTIYAGGDDLLAIVPVEGGKGETLFTLLSDIRQAFRNEFGNGKDDPTLSAGCAICFYKFPLYEAFALAHQMLMTAKGYERPESEQKNALAIHLQKHSGKSVGLRFAHWTDNPCAVKTDTMIKALEALGAQEKLLNSAVTKLRQFERLFALAVDLAEAGNEVAVKNAFDNTFDADIHKEKEIDLYLDSVQELVEHANDCDPIDPNENWTPSIRKLHVMDGLLRLVKFFLEKGEEKDAARTVS